MGKIEQRRESRELPESAITPAGRSLHRTNRLENNDKIIIIIAESRLRLQKAVAAKY